MTTVALAPIDDSNKTACIALSVHTEQLPFVATNERSLAQASDNSKMNPLAILADGQMVGFAMWEARSPKIVSIHRVMIDRCYQRQGYARTAMQNLITQISHLGYATVYLSFKPENLAARHLYEGLGFVFQEKEADGELLYRRGPKAALP